MPRENPVTSVGEVVAMGCPEPTDTSENSSAFCLGGNSVSLNSARTHLVTSGRLAMIPPAAPKTERLIVFMSCPSKISSGNCAQGGVTFKADLHIDCVKYALTRASSTRFGGTWGR